jgi:tetratricopeptide (TPR) repeat protein
VIFELDPTKDTARETIELLRRAVKHSPRFQPAYMALGGFYLRFGQYDSAIPELEKAAEIEETQRAGIHPFVGGITRQADLLFSLGRPDAARLTYQKALAAMELSTHVYRDGYIAETHCGLGDVEYASDNFAEALKHYGEAREIVNAHRERLGMGHVFVRACTGMSKSFHGLGVNREAAQKLQEGMDEFHTRARFDFGVGLGSDDGTYYYLASAYAELQQTGEAVACLEKAFHHGWGDLPQLDADENLKPLEHDPRLSPLITALREADPLP